MIEWTEEKLEENGYKIENAKITGINLSMADHGVLCIELGLRGNGWGVNYGGYVLGHGYVGADEFKGSEAGLECIMRIMDIIGIEKFNDAKGKYVRVATRSWGETVKIIGNIISDKWFDQESFFKDKEKTT